MEDLPFVLTRLRTLLTDDTYSDLIIDVSKGSDQKDFRAHKAIVSLGSPFLKEKVLTCTGGRLILKDISPPLFSIVLHFLYTGNADITPKNAFELKQLSDQLELSALSVLCDYSIRKGISAASVCSLLQSSILHHSDALRVKCLKYIWTHADAVLGGKDVNSLTREQLIEIIGSDNLEVEEVNVFKAVLNWGNANRGETPLVDFVQAMLGYVRFYFIDQASMRSIVLPSGVLPDSVMLDLMFEQESPSIDYSSLKECPLMFRARGTGFDPKRIVGSAVLSKANRVISTSGGGWATVHTRQTFSAGVHAFDVQALTQLQQNAMIGIVAQSNQFAGAYQDRTAVMWMVGSNQSYQASQVQYMQQASSNQAKLTKAGRRRQMYQQSAIAMGDILRVYVDFNKGQVHYFHNGTLLYTSPHKLIKGTQYTFCVDLNNQASVRLMRVTSGDETREELDADDEEEEADDAPSTSDRKKPLKKMVGPQKKTKNVFADEDDEEEEDEEDS